MYKKSITIYTEKKDITISTSKILYVLMDRNVAEVHVIGGEIYKTDGSHGCINTPLEYMEELYDMVKIGTPVVMYY